MNASANLPDVARVLVVDDEPDLRTLYELTLLREGHQVEAAGSLGEARALLQARAYDVVITDMRLPDGLGLQLLRDMAATQRSERCIMITAYGSAENAVEALKCGAFDYLTKPVDLKQFRAVVQSALQSPNAAPSLARAPAAARPADAEPATPAPAATLPASPAALARLVGDSAAMRAVKHRIVKVARSMAPVLVHGESGTGKELVAQAIHGCSHRGDGPFVPVNCGAIPENLLEAEFFGARRGSYTGAVADREGFFQAARGGTLFLDEIGDLPLAMQAKLLRAIQERRVRPLGEPQEEAVDVRVVSATHKDLAAEVQAGRFRQDLYYRLNVIEIVVPPLRERREDLPALCQALLARIGADAGLPAPSLSARQMDDIAQAPLDGNVRELENLLHRAVALGDAGDSAFDEPVALIQTGQTATEFIATQIPPDPEPAHAPEADAAPLPDNLETWLDGQERTVLVRALNETGFNRTAAAARLGLNLRQMRYRMSRLGITAPGNDDASGDAC
ncbi:sigma-54 dependent transcriptional regulator [Ottowia sp.]|uniref:sigma-54-dependent transcriptional regulator n=1 Tax=Ottowia sp. TaxID=1898956 RepID=UPI002CA6D0DA|nr:sigma-54 dependent transcriptional regulator [Ottowia sp.]HOB65189.1 sigma-54 dependent transcriptional regulator [Ottowia sp.]HPZ56801.1 sigma-54 dependent transcriptional regulator [Ottowia sp.]HQD48197.1 sigma-54 dependent transcriptional regulator [Ottowia sp.]